jgi:hypothetical protein
MKKRRKHMRLYFPNITSNSRWKAPATSSIVLSFTHAQMVISLSLISHVVVRGLIDMVENLDGYFCWLVRCNESVWWNAWENCQDIYIADWVIIIHWCVVFDFLLIRTSTICKQLQDLS